MTVRVDERNTDTIAARFEKFHEENPEVYTELVTLARELRRRGYERFGIATIYEVLRWRRMLGTGSRASTAEFAWAVGLFEGEGTFYVNMEQRARRATMSSTDEDVVQRFREIVGVGEIYGPRWQKRNGEVIPDRKPYWCWTCDRWEDLMPLVEEMLSLLGERRRQAAFKILDSVIGLDPSRRQPIRSHKPVDDFRLNNNFRAYYARMMMDREEDLAGCFDVRRIGSETHVAP